MLFQAILKFNLPVNLSDFIRILIPTVGFDILDNIIDWEDMEFIHFDYNFHNKWIDQIPD